jgi:2-polyprenyl-3-methyl-5-hydroxy-6-metoxy-1,4-benzoquinol methylase
MLWTGERVLPLQQQHDVRDLQAHAARYLWAMRYCVHKNVLDVASGEGYGSWILSWAADEVDGIDLSEEAIAHATVTYANQNGSRVAYAVMNAEEITFEENLFDVVVSFETIEHLYFPEKLVAQVHRVLKPGGLFICSAPENSGSTFHVVDYTKSDLDGLLWRHFGKREYYVQDVGREMEIRPNDLPTSEHPTHIFICTK